MVKMDLNSKFSYFILLNGLLLICLLTTNKVESATQFRTYGINDRGFIDDPSGSRSLFDSSANSRLINEPKSWNIFNNFAIRQQQHLPQQSTIRRTVIMQPITNGHSLHRAQHQPHQQLPSTTVSRRIPPKINLRPASSQQQPKPTIRPKVSLRPPATAAATTQKPAVWSQHQDENFQKQTWNWQDHANNPGAYNWGYRWIDAYGNQMFREEQSDGRGTTTGRYSFRDSNGLIRIVEYIADQYGYRTRIRSNEPGIVSSNPAGAQIIRFEDENNIPAVRK